MGITRRGRFLENRLLDGRFFELALELANAQLPELVLEPVQV